MTIKDKIRTLTPYLCKPLAVVAIAVAAACMFFGVGGNIAPALLPDTRPLSRATAIAQGLEPFLEKHWQKPIPLQGPPPRNFSKIEASLSPEACGSCHKQQYADWKESLHSRAMGPGPWGQIVDMFNSAPEDAVFCMTCHAPLSEQLTRLAKTDAAGNRTYEPNANLDKKLQLQGITCAACHVRQHQRFGPPKQQGSNATNYPPGMPNHGGARRMPHFERAEFCKDCHQFDPENSLLVNGKPLQDTYREWQNSLWGRDGAACQDCHMSNRRHLWKGIHDKEWVQGAVRFTPELHEQNSPVGGTATVTVAVVNAAVGHKFPTYITPKIFVRAVLLNAHGMPLPGSQQEQVIGWDVRFVGGEWKEFFDTRIAPGGKFQHQFQWPRSQQAASMRVWVEVHPDHFYHVHFYPAHLQRTDLSPIGRRLIERALDDSGRSVYTLYDRVLPLLTTTGSTNP